MYTRGLPIQEGSQSPSSTWCYWLYSIHESLHTQQYLKHGYDINSDVQHTHTMAYTRWSPVPIPSTWCCLPACYPSCCCEDWLVPCVQGAHTRITSAAAHACNGRHAEHTHCWCTAACGPGEGFPKDRQWHVNAGAIRCVMVNLQQMRREFSGAAASLPSEPRIDAAAAEHRGGKRCAMQHVGGNDGTTPQLLQIMTQPHQIRSCG